MTIKAWVNPPVSLALSELQLEFGCVPQAPTTTTTLPPQTSTTTTTSTTSSTTTLPPLSYDPLLTFTGITPTLKPSTLTTYQILGYGRGAAYSYNIQGGPPNSTFVLNITYSNNATVQLTGTLNGSGAYTSPQDSSTLLPLGVLSAVVTFTPLVGQTVVNGNTRTLEVTVIDLTTTTTLGVPFVSFFNTTTNAQITQANEGTPVTVVLNPSNYANGSILNWDISGITLSDLTGLNTLSGTFTVGSSVSFSFTVSEDFTSEGTETLAITLTYNGATISTTSLEILDTSTVASGTAYLVAGESFNTLSGSATLPTAAVKVMFKLIGGGGSGGGSDAGAGYNGKGGDGAGGTVIYGSVILPASASSKVLVGALGKGGTSANKTGQSGGISNGIGGIGYSFPVGTGFSAGGGNGALAGASKFSGHGGAGGGASALAFAIGNTTYGIASAGGGGGGGGGSLIDAGRPAVENASHHVPIEYASQSILDGQSAVRDNNDGGGGGGGGGNLGTAGANGRDKAVPAFGGTSGRAVKNTTSLLSTGSWERFDIYHPYVTQYGEFWKVSSGYWSNFMNRYAVWPNNAVWPSANPLFYFFVNDTATYTVSLATDNLGSLSIDGVQIISASDNFNGNPVTATVSLARGQHSLSLSVTNTGSIGGVAFTIELASKVVLSSYDLVQNAYGSYESAINQNSLHYYGSGGRGQKDDTVDPSDPGTPGAIAVYWTTNLSATWNDANLPTLPLPDIGLVLPDAVTNSLSLFMNGYGWANSKYSFLGSLFEVKVSVVSGGTPDFKIGSYTTLTTDTWNNFSRFEPFIITGTTQSTVNVSIRRKSDNVVQLSKNITINLSE